MGASSTSLLHMSVVFSLFKVGASADTAPFFLFMEKEQFVSRAHIRVLTLSRNNNFVLFRIFSHIR